MQCGTPLCVFKPLLIVASVAALGMGGYNLATTGCPLGSCDAPEQTTDITAVNLEQSELSGRGSCVEQTDGIETAQLVNLDESGECSEAMMAHCETGGECPMEMKAHCETDGECPMGASQTEMVALQTEANEPSDCQKACEAENAATAEQTADAEQADADTSEG
jgi:hypothetical protein